MRFGMVRFLAQQLSRGVPIPLFVSRATNRAVDAHARRIRRAKTRRRT